MCRGRERPNHVRSNHREPKLLRLFTESTEKMGRGYGGAILAFVELCLLVALVRRHGLSTYIHTCWLAANAMKYFDDCATIYVGVISSFL